MKIDGHCHCGDISFSAEINPDNVVICHCTDCQTLSGSAFRTVLIAAESDVEILSGKPKIYIKTSESGEPREQSFCQNCGSPFYASSVGDGPRQLAIRLGIVTQRDSLIPKKQIWCQSAQTWLNQIDSMEKIDKQP